ncbi:MAG: hypothetical protein HQ461_12885 [Deltaproteobacteria bacterium]|nr:hypothetical protein [Deltaproteobacteria bacterium]
MSRLRNRVASALAVALAGLLLPVLCLAAQPEPTPLSWEPTVAQLVALIEQGAQSADAGAPSAGPRWSPSDVSLTYSFRADGDADSARSRTDAFDEALAPEGVDLRWSEDQSSTEVHYLTLKLDWDFDGRVEDDTRQQAEAAAAAAKRRDGQREQARRAIGLFVERRSLQGELMAKTLTADQVWEKVARIAAVNAELDLLSAGGWGRLLRQLAPPTSPAWLSGLDAD